MTNCVISEAKTHSLNRLSIIIFLVLCASSGAFTSCSAQPVPNNERIDGKWFVNFAHKDIGQTRTLLEFESEGDEFTAYSRKNADRDILGGWKSFLARTFTKSLKNGSILRIESGVYKEGTDTLHLAGRLVTPMGDFSFLGHIVNDKLFATLSTTGRGDIGIISGNREIPKLPLEDYPELFRSTVSLTENKIYNREMLQSTEWSDYVAHMEKTTPKLQDDLEMVFAFFYRASALPFSHYTLMKPMQEKEWNDHSESKTKHLLLEEKNVETAYLKISSFGGTDQEVDSMFEIIIQKNYENLIVDLRNNSGGSVEAGMAFATSVIDTTTFGGVFLTQKWFNNNDEIPSISEYENFPHFTEANYDLIIDGIHNTEGLCLKIIPKERVYKGRLFILTNGNTASTCEPIVYELKKQNRAIIIGEKTAGAMLNGEVFGLENGFKMFIPTADYYTSDGYRIDKKGVAPNIETEKEDALNAALEKVEALK